MSEQHPTPSARTNALPWWLRLCRWLWRLSGFLGTSVLLALLVNIAATWLTTSKGTIPNDAPIHLLLRDWPLALSVGGSLLLLALLFWAISRWSVPSATTLSGAITLRDRERILRRLLVRYQQMLEQSLQGAVQIELGLAERPNAIQNAVSLALRLPEQPERLLPPGTSIVDAYTLAQQELLILGEPGAGKSTLLLELALRLVQDAEQEPKQPLPVLLPLSSWAIHRPPLQKWIIEQFAWLYQLPQKLCEQCVEANLVLPLLDGLDEMGASARPACVRAINTYHREHLHPLVICSRTSEYEAIAGSERLALNSAVAVQPLSREQVDAHLLTLGRPLAALRAALKKNPALAEVATTPLMVQILILIYHGSTVRQLTQQGEDLQRQVWTDYVQQMVERKGNLKRYSLEGTTRWLSRLAQYMRTHDQTIFPLEYLYSRLLPERYHALYLWSFAGFGGLLYGFLIGLLFGLLYWLFFGLLHGLLFGLLCGLLCGFLVGLVIVFFVEFDLWAAEALSHQGAPSHVQDASPNASFWHMLARVPGILGFLLGFGSLLLFGEISKLRTYHGKREAPVRGLLFLAIVSFPFGLIGGLIGGPLAGLVGGLLAMVVGWLLFGRGEIMDSELLPGSKLLAVLSDAMLRFWFHFWLRRNHILPWKIFPFLEDAAARSLLRREGKGYSFMHRLLLDYFADLVTAPPSPSAPKAPPIQPTSPP